MSTPRRCFQESPRHPQASPSPAPAKPEQGFLPESSTTCHLKLAAHEPPPCAPKPADHPCRKQLCTSRPSTPEQHQAAARTSQAADRTQPPENSPLPTILAAHQSRRRGPHPKRSRRPPPTRTARPTPGLSQRQRRHRPRESAAQTSICAASSRRTKQPPPHHHRRHATVTSSRRCHARSCTCLPATARSSGGDAASAHRTATEWSRRRRVARALPDEASGGGERRRRRGKPCSSLRGRPGAARHGRTGAEEDEDDGRGRACS